MTNINAQEIRAIKIPLPPIEMQRDLVHEMDAARAARRQKLADADALLRNIDSYILGKLEIELPQEEYEKVFAVRQNDVWKNKLGPSLYSPELRKFLHALTKGRFPTAPFCEKVCLNPRVQIEHPEQDALISFVPMDAVSDKAVDQVVLEERSLSEVRKGYTAFSEGDVLWAKITPCMENGKSFIASDLTNGIGFGSTEFHVFRSRSAAVLPDYLFAFMALGPLRHVARLAFTGSAGHQRVPDDFLADLPLPLPPEKLQSEIADEARNRRNAALALQREALTDWLKAKQHFERDLLCSPE
jgi:type I restriction enzyme S subunit